MDLTSYRELLRHEVGKYYQLNDPAHLESHFMDVEQLANFINVTQLDGRYSKEMIMAAAYIHDMFASSRNIHHELSATWAAGTDNIVMARFTPLERSLIADACRCHRASFKGQFPTEFAELINAADRGMPKDFSAMVLRSLDYNSAQGYKDWDLYASVSYHMRSKYGSDGYARYPDLYTDLFADNLLLLREKADNVTAEKVRDIFLSNIKPEVV